MTCVLCVVQICFCSRSAAAKLTDFARRRWDHSWPSIRMDASGTGGTSFMCGDVQVSAPSQRALQRHHAAPIERSDSSFEVVEGPYFGPECKLDGTWLRYISAARSRVWVVHWRVEWKPVAAALTAASARGVGVSVYTSHISKSLLRTNATSPRAPWVAHVHQFSPHKRANASTMFHHKIVLIDEDLVLLGSVNMFAKSILQDSEDLVVLRSRLLNRQYRDMCERHAQFAPLIRWRGAKRV